MTSDDGNVPESTRDRDDRGLFLPGNKISRTGGRPKGVVMDFMVICREKSREHGVDLSDMVWAVVQAMFREAVENGNVNAGKILLERFCGPADKTIEVNVDNRSVNVSPGPPVPNDYQLGQYLKQLVDVSAELIDEGVDIDESGDKE